MTRSLVAVSSLTGPSWTRTQLDQGFGVVIGELGSVAAYELRVFVRVGLVPRTGAPDLARTGQVPTRVAPRVPVK